MKLELHIQPSERSHPTARTRPIHAWFLPGADLACWMDELCRSGLTHEALRFAVLEGDETSASPCGVLVVRSDREALNVGMGGIPCCFLGRHLCVPSNASVLPSLLPEEADQLCDADLVFAHPSLGVFALNNEDLRPLSDFLTPPPLREEAWNRACVASRQLAPRCEIHFIRPPASDTSSLESIFGEDAGQIGSTPPSKLARDQRESEEAAGSLKPRLLDGIAKGLVHFTRLMSSASAGAGEAWMERLRGWAVDRLGREGVRNPRQEELHRLRQREIELLTQQLLENPEVGLQHAIPLTPQPFRGLSEPGAQLPKRPVDYASGHDGSRAGDVWELGTANHSRLRKIYFELASREIMLGRFRRAAYIYAHLLGDFSSAANALAQGRFFREAAELYETRLGNPLQSARCLVEGGLLREAMERYLRLGHTEEAAKLHEQLGETQQAAVLWRQLVVEAHRSGQFVRAAQLLDRHLDSTREAITLLREGWPESPQALQCLDAEWMLLEKAQDHRLMHGLIDAARDAEWPKGYLGGVLKTLNVITRKVRDPRLSAHAEDAARVLASKSLASASLPTHEVGLILEQLELPSTRDPLLSRDLSRYLQRRNAAQIAASRSANLSRERESAAQLAATRRIPRRTLDFTLPASFDWMDVQQEETWFFAFGSNSARSVAVRGTWDGDVQTVSLGWDLTRLSKNMIVQPTHQQGSRVAVVDSRQGPITSKLLPIQDLFFHQECRIETPSWLPSMQCALAFDAGGGWTLHRSEGRSILSSFTHSGQLRRTVDLSDVFPVEIWDLWGGSPGLLACESGVAIAIGRVFVFVHRDGEVTSLRLESDFVRYARSVPDKSRRIGLCLIEGLDLFCPLRKTRLSLGDLTSPHAAWISETTLMVVSSDKGHQFKLIEDTGDPLREVGIFAPGSTDILALLPTPQGHLAIVTRSGRVTLWSPAVYPGDTQ